MSNGVRTGGRFSKRSLARLALVGSTLWLGAGPAAHALTTAPVAPVAPVVPVTQIEHAAPVEAAGSATRGTAVQVEATFPPPPTVPGDSLDLPADSGSGRRVVYSKGAQRVWLLEADETLYNTHRVSGRMDQPAYGTYAVYSRSPFTCSNAHSNICMRWMVRFAHSFRGDNIGFHEIPKRDGVPMETDAQIGQPLSGGCVRQLTADAIIMWEWAQLGTVVIVVP